MFVLYLTFQISLFYCVKASNPLFLTPYIESGNITAGQEAAKVKPFAGQVSSYSGFLTVGSISNSVNNSFYNSNLFFWFFPRNTSSWENASLVLWLQGGPGESSLYGLFEENGPYVFKKGVLKERYYSWSTDVNLLYIDNPVGAGFSFTESEDGYARNETAIGKQLYEAVRQFYLLFPLLQKNPFIISGESYAGKYVPYLALTIHENRFLYPKINLYGLFIGNPLISGDYMLHYNEYLYWIGLLDKQGQEILGNSEEHVNLLIKSNQWKEATETFEKIFFESQGPTLFQNLTWLTQHYHFLKKFGQPIPYVSFLRDQKTKEALHVGSLEFNSGRKAYNYLKEDLLQSSKSTLEFLLQYYNVLIYAGQLDIICPFYLVENVLHHLRWKYAEKYETAKRKIFHVDQYLAGYYKTVDKLTTVLIRNSGHMVPHDKPQWARVLLRRFVAGEFDKDT